MADLNVVSVTELITWDAFPIQNVTSVCQLSAYCRCNNEVTDLARMAPLFAFGTATGQVVIMQVAPTRVTDQAPTVDEQLAADGKRIKTTSNQRQKTKDRFDALRAAARVECIGLVTLPQPQAALPLGAIRKFSGLDGSAGNLNASASSKNVFESPITSAASLREPATLAAQYGAASSPAAAAQARAAGSVWTVNNITYSPFSNTIFCLSHGTIYILHLVSDDTALMDGTDSTCVQMVVVGRLPPPPSKNNSSNAAAADQGAAAAAAAASASSSSPSGGGYAVGGWKDFIVHASPAEIKIMAFAANQFCYFVVDPKPLTSIRTASQHNINPDGFSGVVKLDVNLVNTFSRSAKDPVVAAAWMGPLFVCNSGPRHYSFYAPEFLNPVKTVSATVKNLTGSRSNGNISIPGESIFREKSSALALRVTTLYDSFRINNESDASQEAPAVAVLVSEASSASEDGDSPDAADVALPFAVHIYNYDAAEGGVPILKREIKILFSATSAVHISSSGPWLVVVATDGGGVDIHDWTTGQHVQSAAEEFADFTVQHSMSSLMTRSSAVVQPFGKMIQWRSEETSRKVQGLMARMYVERSTEIVIGGTGKLLLLMFEAPKAILSHLLKAAPADDYDSNDRRDGEMMAIQEFAVSVGNRDFFSDMTAVSEAAAAHAHPAMPDGYDDLLKSFSHVRLGVTSSPGASNSDVKQCFECKSSFGFLSKRHFVCFACLRHFCEKCCPVSSSEELIKRGVQKKSTTSSNATLRMCSPCLVRLDENMFTLLYHGKYRDALHYLLGTRAVQARQQNPNQFGSFANNSFASNTIRLDDLRNYHLPHIAMPEVDEILWRCIRSGKVSLCAQLLPMSCGTDEGRWQNFVMWFLTDADAAMSLARNIPFQHLGASVGKFVYSSILIALVKYSPAMLMETMGRWPATLYSAALVTSAIESALKSKLDVAMQTQRECQRGGGAPVLWDSPWNWRSIGHIYIDEEVKTLVSALLMLCKKKRMYVDALRLHLNYFEKFVPHMAYEGRERGGTIVALDGETSPVLDGVRGVRKRTFFESPLSEGSSSTGSPVRVSAFPSVGGDASVAAAAPALPLMTVENAAEQNRAGRAGTLAPSLSVVDQQKAPGSARSSDSQPATARSRIASGSTNGIAEKQPQQQQQQQSQQHQRTGSRSSNMNSARGSGNHSARSTLSRTASVFGGGGGASPPPPQPQHTTHYRALAKDVGSRVLLNSFEWINQHQLNDVLLRPDERMGGQGVYYDGPSMLPLLIQIWKMDAVKHLLQWPELTSRPDVIDSLVAQLSTLWGIGKDGLSTLDEQHQQQQQAAKSVKKVGDIVPSSPAGRMGGGASTSAAGGGGDGGGKAGWSLLKQKTGMLLSPGPQSPSQQGQPFPQARIDYSRIVAMVPPVGQENDGPQILQSLLHEITLRDIGATAKHHNLLACLYVHHAPHRLLDFLRQPLVTSLDYAKLSQLVRQKRMFGELAYIMGRSGNAVEAIRLVVRCLRDVKFAIQFVEDTDPDKLWDELIRNVIQSPQLIGSFLDHAIGHYDIAKFLNALPEPNRLQVPRAAQRLGTVLTESMIDLSLNQTSLSSHNEENLQLLHQHYMKAKSGVRFSPASTTCMECGVKIFNATEAVAEAAAAAVAASTATTAAAETGNSNKDDSNKKKKKVAGKDAAGSRNAQATASASVVTISEAVVFSRDHRIMHGSCAQHETGGTVPAVSPDHNRLMVKERRRKQAARTRRDFAHLFASIEVFRDSDVRDICEILPRPLRYTIFSYLDFDSQDSCKEVSKAWYLHVRALQCGMDRYERAPNEDNRTHFQQYMWLFGSYPGRRPPFELEDEDDVLAATAGLLPGGGHAVIAPISATRRAEDLPVPVGDVFVSRNE